MVSPLKRLVLVVFLFINGTQTAFTQQDEDGAETVPTTSLKLIKDEHENRKALAQSRLTEAQNAFDAEVAKSKVSTIEQLAKLAKLKVSKGDLKEASRCWEAVLDIDDKNDAATEFFRTIGRLDLVRKRRRSAKHESRIKTKFRAADGRLELELIGPDTYRSAKRMFIVEFKTPYALGLKSADGTRFQVHPDWYYGRKGDTKWVSWGRGVWTD